MSETRKAETMFLLATMLVATLSGCHQLSRSSQGRLRPANTSLPETRATSPPSEYFESFDLPETPPGQALR